MINSPRPATYHIGIGALAVALATALPSFGEERFYVNANANGTNTGLTWEDAFTDLQAALDAVEESDGAVNAVWVAQGRYLPSQRIQEDDERSATFWLPENIRLYGGFEGTATSLEERDPVLTKTVLDGDLKGDDEVHYEFDPERRIVLEHYEDNVYHVLSHLAPESIAVVDGFVIRGGSADGGYATQSSGGGAFNAGTLSIRNCRLVENRAWPSSARSATPSPNNGGGAVYNGPSANLTLVHCVLARNSSRAAGGAILNAGGFVDIDSTAFEENHAAWGGAIRNNGGGLAICASSFVSNSVWFTGGAIYQTEGNELLVENVQFRGNLGQEAGAVYVERAALVLRGSFLSANSATGAGGAISSRQAPVILEGCNAEYNRAEWGGALSVDGSASIIDCRFYRNHSLDGAAIGGGDSDTEIVRCGFEDNTVLDSYGGVVSSLSTLRVADSRFVRNAGSAISSRGYGQSLHGSDILFSDNGATAVRARRGSVLLERCSFYHNYGGGVWADTATVKLTNCILAHNTNYGFGGGVEQYSGSVELNHCTVVANHAYALGGGVMTGGVAAVRNSIFWANGVGDVEHPRVDESTQILAGLGITIEFSCLDGWTGDLGGNGNFGSSPEFVQLRDAYGENQMFDLRLSKSSPCLNAGDPDFDAKGGALQDLDGHARVLYGRSDMGAYEFGIGDFNWDRTVTLDDFIDWVACATDPQDHLLHPTCVPGDFNADGDVDLFDLAGFQRAFEGATEEP